MTRAVQVLNDVLTRAENPFDGHRLWLMEDPLIFNKPKSLA